ncbi:uncharacterized protein LOC110942827 [Helianthus annuus]|uniref:uncharacterized protein LOC110942827 n=1 Tax=Helianthus annuus TaxID=4232 RepID=UPI000B9086DF|nr:uncharacterized protein LOC110942827 [Helianthus annuus]
MDLTQKQIRNAFDTMKSKYVGWCYLRNKTGNLYNPETNMFTLMPQEWEDFKKGHPRAMSLKTRPLPHLDLHIAVFEGLSATGGNQWTSTQTSGVSSSPHVQTLQIQDGSFHNLENDDGDSHEQSFQNGDEVPTNNKAQTSNDNETRPNKKAKTSKTTITLDDLAKDMQQALKHMVKSMEGPSTDECYEKLKLVGLEPIDPLFLAAFNMVFTFLVARWEGVAHDSRILSESLTNANAPFPLPPPDKYYLCDAAYAHTRGFMAPYRNVRYWLGDFRRNRPLTDKEKFNHAHAKLRNVIERSYGGLSDDFFDEYDHPNVRLQDGDEHAQDGGEEVAYHGSAADREFMSQLRDQIAQELMQNNIIPQEYLTVTADEDSNEELDFERLYDEVCFEAYHAEMEEGVEYDSEAEDHSGY